MKSTLINFTRETMDLLRETSDIPVSQNGFISETQGWLYSFPGLIYNFKIIPHGQLVVWFGDKRKFQTLAWVKNTHEAQDVIDNFILGINPPKIIESFPAAEPVIEPSDEIRFFIRKRINSGKIEFRRSKTTRSLFKPEDCETDLKLD